MSTTPVRLTDTKGCTMPYALHINVTKKHIDTATAILTEKDYIKNPRTQNCPVALAVREVMNQYKHITVTPTWCSTKRGPYNTRDRIYKLDKLTTKKIYNYDKGVKIRPFTTTLTLMDNEEAV